MAGGIKNGSHEQEGEKEGRSRKILDKRKHRKIKKRENEDQRESKDPRH